MPFLEPNERKIKYNLRDPTTLFTTRFSVCDIEIEYILTRKPQTQ